MDDLDDLLNEVAGSDCTSQATFGGPKALQSYHMGSTAARPNNRQNDIDDIDQLIGDIGVRSMASSQMQSLKSIPAAASTMNN